MLAAAHELAAESGGETTQQRTRIAGMNATLAGVIRGVLVIAQRRPRDPGRATQPQHSHLPSLNGGEWMPSY